MSLNVPIGEINILLYQEIEDDLIGTVLWDSSIVLSRFLLANSEFVRGLSVIELGCGIGLASIAALKAGARHVSLTDQLPPSIDLARRNLTANLSTGEATEVDDVSHSTDEGTTYSFHAFSWGEDPKHLHPPFQVVLCSDLVYRDDTHAALVAALGAITDRNTVILLAQEERHPPSEQKFFALFDQQFTREPLDTALHLGGLSEPDHMFLWRCRRRDQGH
ncbi:putative methyltransferase small domain protein [Paratrimastix pyriformis]|uniref:Methyltransferase small domain protein n=1 Tax=Paratrimastix pyriformis TaxID=342808 RepID=A0ABQ8UIN0_9EUKA|nr:putative methyltransferase small domain protein [Paratrimastix pyriformis]